MTDQLFAPRAGAVPVAPIERLGRWVLHRAGIVNVWQYDRAEIAFAGGRALLRGKNGAGKSKALEMLLPLLFDADVRTIDAAGRDRTSVYWLMTDGREPGNHVGYVWLELRLTSEDGQDRFCTLGAGLKASTSTRQASTWWFLAEDARVGADIHLGPEVSSDKLRDQLGPDVVTTAAEHRRRVGSRLFGLHDEARFANLLHLLRRLRDPNIGNKIEAGELAAVLSDALPPPSEEALEKAAERFDSLDQIKEQLERTQRTAAALQRFLDTYSGYARTVVRHCSQLVLDAVSERRRREKEAKRLAEESAAATAARLAADQEAAQLREQEELAGRELEGLRASDAYKEHQQLADRRAAVEAKRAMAESAGHHHAQLQRVAQEAAAEEAGAVTKAEQAGATVAEQRPALVRLAGEASIDQAVVPSDAAGIPHAVTVADGRRRAAEQVRALAAEAAEAKAIAGRAEEQSAQSEQELTDALESANEANAAWVTESRAWRDAVRTWPGPAGEGLPRPDWSALHRSLADGPAGADELTAVPVLASDLLAPVREGAAEAEGAARAGLTEAQLALGKKEAERAALEAQEEARPPVSRFRTSERDERAGAPFYELVDVRSELAAEDRVGLEAALEASGLLDAWVGNDGLVLHPSTADVIVRTDAPRLAEGVPTLADALVTNLPHVQRLLRTVGLGDQGDLPWISMDGRWSLGALRGAWTKPESEYLGAGTRRATRARRLAELARQCDELREVVATLKREADSARERRERLDRLMGTFPSSEGVRAASSRAEALVAVAASARARFDVDRRAAELARTAAAQAASELGHAAAAESLPTALAALDEVRRAAGDLARELREWTKAWAQWDERRAAAAAASDRRAQREEAAARARAEMEARQWEHESAAAGLGKLEQAVGSTVAEVLAAIAESERRREAARLRFPAAQKRAVDLAEAAGGAARVAAEALESASQAIAAVGAAGQELGRVVVLPGLSEAALGTEWVWDPGDAEGAARTLRSRAGEDGPVGDQVVLNRLRELEEALSGGYDVAIGEEGGVKFFHVADDTGRQPLPTVTARVVAEAAAAKERLAVNEREIIERFLLGELGEELRERLLEAEELVESANRALGPVRTSHGKGARLAWRLQQEEPGAARVTSELLKLSPRSVEEDVRLREALMELIEAQREKDSAAGYFEHLRVALDYRRWYRFQVMVVDDSRPDSQRALSPRLGLSQGEQRVLSYLALFAGASAHYEGLGAECPRLLLLDDAFAKVDEPTHGRLLALLVDLDLDFMLTSERMWGCFPEVPSLEIYEALREPSVPGVALVHFRWDGRQRHLVGL